MTMTENELKDGRVVGIAGPVIDVEFPPHGLPELNTALEFTVEIEGAAHDGARRGRAAARPRSRPCGLHEADRRPEARHPGAQHRPRHPRAGR